MTGLAREIMVADAESRGRHFPAYRGNPIAETSRAVEGIATDAAFVADYARFLRDMVYGEAPAVDDAVATLQGLARCLGRTRP